MYVCVQCVSGACGGQERRLEPLGTGVIDNCELLCGIWELNPGPLQVHPVFLASEPPLQLLVEG